MAKKYFKFSSIKNKKFTVDTTSETIKKTILWQLILALRAMTSSTAQ